VAYRADIEIGVKGIQQLQALTKQINTLSIGVDGVNKRLTGASQSVNAYNANLAKAAATLNKVNAGTIAEADAVRQYVQALGQANAARDRQNKLIQQQIVLQRKAVPTANAGFGMQGPALPPTVAAGGRRGGGGGGRLGGAISGSIIGGAFPLLFGQGGGAAAGGAVGGLVGGLAGPGGSFAGSLLGTLLGDIASRGQAVKQLADDIGFSAQQTRQLSDAFKVANTDVEKFTGVIQNIRGVGLAIEDQAKAIQLVTRLTEAYGGSFEKTGNAITSTLESGKVTQATLNQLTSQGINIQQALADKYNVSRTELLQMAKDGEISAQSLIDTLVEVANAGTTGATKIKSSYEETATAMYNAFANATTGINNSFINTQNTAVTAFDRIVKAITPALVELSKITGQVISLGAYAVELGVKFASAFYAIPGAIQVVATALGTMIPGLNTIYTTLSAIRNLAGGGGKGGLATSLNLNAGMDGANWPAGIPRPGAPVQSFQVPSEFGPTGAAAPKGPKPPKDKTAQMQEDLVALESISLTQDGIRDALFEGNKQLAIRLEYDQKVADINRDTAKALLNANYETEKTVIRAQEIVRLKDAELERSDKLRELTRDINTAYEETFRTLQEGVDWSKGFTFPDTVREFIKEARKELQDLQAVAVTVSQGIGTAIGNTFTNGLTSLITGAATVKSVFADLLQSVGDILAKEGARMIATYIAIGIAKAFAGLGGKNIFDQSMGIDTLGTISSSGLEGAGALGTGLPISSGGVGGIIPGYANGGFAAANRPAIVGEKGPELFLPRTGGSVVPSSDLRAAMGSAPGTAGSPVLNMSFQSTNIGGVEYVSRDQLEAAMAATRRDASRDGARRGMSMTLDKLQQSPGTRSRVGLR
jgi:tape measure domain-containing protein